MRLVIFSVLFGALSSCGVIGKMENESCLSELDELTEEIVYTRVNQQPEYFGGIDAIIKFFIENYKHSNREEFQATFLLEFIINTKGEVVAPRIKDKKVNEYTSAEKEAVRVLKAMPNWTPGKCNRKIVPVKTYLPLRF